MWKPTLLLAGLAASVSPASAGGIDRSGQGLGGLFEKGRYVEFSYGSVGPSVGGTDVLGNPIADVGQDYSLLSFSYKYDINPNLSFAVVLDQPFGGDVLYGGNPATTMLGGTTVSASATALTGLLRYKFNENFSIHGGVRAVRSNAYIRLSGLAYAGLSGYNVTLNGDTGIGYVIGAAYERPEIALRIAVTYNSSISHDFETTEVAPFGNSTSITEVTLPQSVNVDFQTGIAKDTLIFGQVRWADWEALTLEPATFSAVTGGAGLIELDSTTTFTLGVGRKFNETWSGAFSVSYERELDPLVSPLSPTNGRYGATLAAIYTKDKLKITTGINFTSLGDALPETGTPDVARASMTGNSSVGIGVKVAYMF